MGRAAAERVITFQNGISPDAGYAGATDATITTWSGNSYANLGGLDYLQIGEAGDVDEFRLLARFDLGGWLPAGVRVDEAQLELRAYDSGYDDDPQDGVAHRVTAEWVEGDGWDLTADGRSEGVTWVTARPGVTWATPGGDFDPTELDRASVAANPDGWYRWDVTTAVREWAGDDASNHGLLLEPDDAPWAHHQFRSSECPTVTLRPRLVVTYTSGVPADYAAYLPVVARDHAPQPPLCPHPLTGVTISGPEAPPSGERLRPGDLAYRGAFVYPAGDGWAYSGHALAYYPGGDPTGPADGYPGSLYAAGHAHHDLVGAMSIPAPVVAEEFGDLPQASTLRSLADITAGWKDTCAYSAGCIYRELDGLVYLENVDRIAWNLRDWYNVSRYDQDSLGWSNLDMTDARGVWHIGARPSDGDLFHNARTCNYLLKAPRSFADLHLGGRWLLAGNHREAGALGGSQGPALYALAPWRDGNPPASGQNLEALPLIYYPEIYACVWDGEEDINARPARGTCHFPDYRAVDNWGGGAWVETASGSGILVVGRKGLGDNCYGAASRCGDDPCAPSSGYHAYPYAPQILFYDPEEVREVADGARDPWQVLPYDTHSPEDEVFDSTCALLGAVAYDRERGLIYVTEREAGASGETAVHVWQVP